MLNGWLMRESDHLLGRSAADEASGLDYHPAMKRPGVAEPNG